MGVLNESKFPIQILASTTKNLLLFDLGLAAAMSTIIIPVLTGEQTVDPAETIQFSKIEASWYGKLSINQLNLKSVNSCYLYIHTAMIFRRSGIYRSAYWQSYIGLNSRSAWPEAINDTGEHSVYHQLDIVVLCDTKNSRFLCRSFGWAWCWSFRSSSYHIHR